jgi:ribosomal protein S18 acetylase RimI-like enzyme
MLIPTTTDAVINSPARARDEAAAELNLVCRRLHPGESRVYRDLRMESLRRYPDAYGALLDEERARPRLPFEDAIDLGTADRFVVSALRGGRPLGMAAFARREGGKKRHRGEITQVYVAPEARGRSTGAALMRTTLDLAFALGDIDQVELSLVTTNASALRLYTEFGFETYAAHTNYLKLGDRAWDQFHMLLRHAAYRPLVAATS